MRKSLKTNGEKDSSQTARALQVESLSTIVVNRNGQSGFALIDMIFVCGLIGVLSGIALPRLLLAKQAAGSASAIGSMRVINSSQLTFALTCGSGFYAPKLPTLGQAPPGTTDPFLSPDLTYSDVVIKASYQMQMSGTA